MKFGFGGTFFFSLGIPFPPLKEMVVFLYPPLLTIKGLVLIIEIGEKTIIPKNPGMS